MENFARPTEVEVGAEEPEYEAKTELGRKLVLLRKEIERSGVPSGGLWSRMSSESVMTKREMVIREVEEVPETLLDEILGFVRLLQDAPRREALETAFASERVLSRDWLTPEEDAAWRDL